MAAAAARIDHGTQRAEVVSMACIVDLRESPALGLAVAHLAGSLAGGGLVVVFEPQEPVSPAHRCRIVGRRPLAPRATVALVRVPAHRCRHDSSSRVRHIVTGSLRVTSLAALTQEQVEAIRSRGQFAPHPDDVGECSPVLLGEGDLPLGFVILRRSRPGSVVHWSWVDPAMRRQGLILLAGDALFDMLERNPQAVPVRFRVQTTNAASRHLVAGALADAVEPLFSTQTWTSLRN